MGDSLGLDEGADDGASLGLQDGEADSKGKTEFFSIREGIDITFKKSSTNNRRLMGLTWTTSGRFTRILRRETLQGRQWGQRTMKPSKSPK